MGRTAILFFLICIASTACHEGSTPDNRRETFLAFSLGVAERLLKSQNDSPDVAKNVGGISQLVGAVIDSARREVVVVGRSREGDKSIALDDVVVAMRAILGSREWPLVSIDPPLPGMDTQPVRLEGGVRDTRFGESLLAADVVLKELALGLRPTGIRGVPSYLELRAHFVEETGDMLPMLSRFVMVPARPDFAVSKENDAVVLERLDVTVKTDSYRPRDPNSTGTQLVPPRDDAGLAFAAGLTTHYDELMAAHLPLQQLKNLFETTAVACGLRSLIVAADGASSGNSLDVRDVCNRGSSSEGSGPAPGLDVKDLGYWLSEYAVPLVPTPRDYRLRGRSTPVSLPQGQTTMTQSGGIELRALRSRLYDGSVEALRELVLKSRPSPDALTWRVPLEGWSQAGAQPAQAAQTSTDPFEAEMESRFGFYVSNRFEGRSAASTAAIPIPELPKLNTYVPTYSRHESMAPVAPPIHESIQPRVGGVRLDQTAKIEDLDDLRIEGVAWDEQSQQLRLVAKGAVVQLSGEYMDDFATVIETVYGGEDPGVSIDPGPIRNLMNVRYIGKVRDTRLGWTMFEADRLLKGYTMGEDNLTRKPMHMDLEDFQTVMDMLKGEPQPPGIAMRFWFVPGEIRAHRAGDVLMFDEPDKIPIQVKTEFLNAGLRGQSHPAAKKFADFVTAHYDEFAKKHPELRDLREYAKMVAVAKYLKQRGVPLTWLAIARRGRSASRPTPLQTPSFLVDMWWGGVDLNPQLKTVAAWSAVAEETDPARDSAFFHPVSAGARATASPTVPADLPNIVPTVQYSYANTTFTSLQLPARVTVRPGRTLLFQTDAAVAGRAPVVEMVRYYDRQRRDAGELGPGWYLLLPYRLSPSRDTKEIQGVPIPKSMTVIDPIEGRDEILALGEDRQGLVGYFPQQDDGIPKVLLQSDATYLIEDARGNSFHFDEKGRLTAADMGRDNRWGYAYSGDRLAVIWPLPSLLESNDEPSKGGAKPIRVAGLDMPQEISVVDRIGSEALGFGRDQEGVVGYFAGRAKRWVKLVGVGLRTFWLEDVCKNVFIMKWPDILNRVQLRESCQSGAGWDYPRIEISYDHLGHIREASFGPEGRLLYDYDGAGRLATVVGLDGRRTYYEYGPDGELRISTKRARPLAVPPLARHWAATSAATLVLLLMAVAGTLFYLRNRARRMLGQ